MTDIEKVRLLIGDQASATFTDDEIQGLLDLQSDLAGSNDQFYMAASLGLRSLGAKLSIAIRGGSSSVKIGDFEFSTSLTGLVKSFLDQAQAYMELIWNNPAFTVIEEDLSPFNELIIIHNQIYRNLP